MSTLLGLLLSVPIAHGQAPEFDSKTSEAITRLARMHQAWGPQMNSPGVSITLKETERSLPEVKYEIHAVGFPRERRYTILSWPANRPGPQEMLTGVTLNAAGVAICAGTPGTCTGNGPNDPIDIVLRPVKGEPARIALVSEGDEDHLKALVNFAPIPNRTTDKGCTLESIMLLPDSAFVAIQGTGFKPNADLTFLGESEGEHHDGHGTADADGKYFVALAPNVKGKEKGTTRVSVISPDCSLSLSFHWGKNNYEYK
jgi:hypothetical protein